MVGSWEATTANLHKAHMHAICLASMQRMCNTGVSNVDALHRACLAQSLIRTHTQTVQDDGALYKILLLHHDTAAAKLLAGQAMQCQFHRCACRLQGPAHVIAPALV
jgi:hypothetical protein